MKNLRNRIEFFIEWLVTELRDTSKNCTRETKW